MRISSLQIFNIANNSLADANEALVHTQEQLSSGKRVLNPSDDPVASTKIMQLTEELSSIKQYGNNINIAQNNLVLEESILKSTNNLVQRIQEIAVQAGNTATLSENEYEALASEVDSRIEEMMSLLNSQNANGDYIFAGYKSRIEPFTGSSLNGFSYNGDDGQQFIKIANNTTIATSDSGKTAFVDIESSTNTITTYASPNNQSNPPITVSVGSVVNQSIYDDFYPEDIIISFNADSDVSPAGKNFTATERSTGRVIVQNERYVSGNPIEINGVSFRIIGAPVSGTPATPSTRAFGADSAASFTFNFSGAASETMNITVGNRTETLILDANITSSTDVSTMFNSVANGNAAKLASLGVTVDSSGFSVPVGMSLRLSNGSANIATALGIDTVNGSTSTDGVLAQPGDRVFVDSTNKQDILTTMARFSEAMKSFDGTTQTRDNLEEVIANTLDNLTSTQTSVLDVMSKIGARFNTLESTSKLHLDAELVSQEILAELRDVDYAEAATRLSSQSLILQAAQSSFVRVSQLTLFTQL